LAFIIFKDLRLLIVMQGGAADPEADSIPLGFIANEDVKVGPRHGFWKNGSNLSLLSNIRHVVEIAYVSIQTN
jgi:hypothetical protein